MKNENRLDSLFEELVPASGKADSLAGELVRATSRIGFRFLNDGDQLGRGYGRETCNPAGRFILAKTPREIGDLVAAMWYTEDENAYEAQLDTLVGKVAEYVETNPGLRNTPTEDMWSFRDTWEDVDEDEYEDGDEDW